MINKIVVENYKSLHHLDLDVGRFNVLIGENGCGKSNILESVTLAAAVEADKLDNEFLSSRGIRVTDSHFMRSAFGGRNNSLPIKITVWDEFKNISKQYSITNDNKPYSKWTNFDNDGSIKLELPVEHVEFLIKLMKEKPQAFDTESNSDFYINLFNKIKNKVEKLENLQNFVIYSPENTALRNFYKEGQIEPLGINGEGLLKLLKTIRESAALKSNQKSRKEALFSFFKYKNEAEDFNRIDEIHAALQLFDWYKDLEIPKDLSESEDKVRITDKYLEEPFDQRSANEGFLFVLFYISLIVSEDTPKIFAIDNIDASLNPKLCSKLITELTRLAKKYDKQVFVTTHNPAILDGLDLGDDEQRLLVISRNKLGHTRYKRINLEDKPKSSSGEPLKLSEAFLRGYLGALPKGF